MLKTQSQGILTPDRSVATLYDDDEIKDRFNKRTFFTDIFFLLSWRQWYMSRVTVHNKQRFVDFVPRIDQLAQSLITVANHYSCLNNRLTFDLGIRSW